MSYAKARSDFEYLESLAELDDQVELDSERLGLMENPCKAKAGEMYEAGIRLWFGENGLSFDDEKKVQRLRKRYYA